MGYLRDLDKTYSMKKYIANLSEEMVEDMYDTIMGGFCVFYLQIVPSKNATLDEVFFSGSKSFSDFYKHEYFLRKLLTLVSRC